jgi:signal transduction histidine kinase
VVSEDKNYGIRAPPTGHDDSHLEISVSDTEQGIRPDFLPHVFDRFRQADSTSKRTHGGRGLGLAIVRHLLEIHGAACRQRAREKDRARC